MTQSGASQAIQQLEEHLQVRLIDRSKRPFLLTAEGSAFHTGCVQILRQFETLTEDVRAIGNEISGRASMAAIYSVGLCYLPGLQLAVKAKHPKAEVRYQFGHPDEIYRLVEQGLVDFGLVSYAQASKTISTTDWIEEPMRLVAAASHPLTAKPEVYPQDLLSESLVAFAPNLRIRHEVDRYLRHMGITMHIAGELDNIDSVKRAIEVRAALAFLPEPTVHEELTTGAFSMLNCPWLNLKRPLALIQRRNVALGRTARAVIELLLEQREHVACATNHNLVTDPVGQRSTQTKIRHTTASNSG